MTEDAAPLTNFLNLFCHERVIFKWVPTSILRTLVPTDSLLLITPKNVPNGSGFLVFTLSPRFSARVLSCSLVLYACSYEERLA